MLKVVLIDISANFVDIKNIKLTNMWCFVFVSICVLILAVSFIYGNLFKNRFPVLMYHSVSRDSKSSLTILESELERHFEYLKKKKYETVFYDEIDLNKKQVLLTFDDGYVNNKDLLIPLLVKYNFKATIFIPFKFIGNNDDWWTKSQQIMSFEDLKSLNQKYIKLGWHSYSHLNFKYATIDKIKLDFENSFKVINENKLDVSPIFAYPYGGFSKDLETQKKVVDLMKKYNIKMAFRIGNKLNLLPLKNMFLVKRIDIKGTDSFKVFCWKLKYGRVKPF